jgi:hypothetical protein
MRDFDAARIRRARRRFLCQLLVASMSGRSPHAVDRFAGGGEKAAQRCSRAIQSPIRSARAVDQQR